MSRFNALEECSDETPMLRLFLRSIASKRPCRETPISLVEESGSSPMTSLTLTSVSSDRGLFLVFTFDDALEAIPMLLNVSEIVNLSISKIKLSVYLEQVLY
jgi:hypothetical protein